MEIEIGGLKKEKYLFIFIISSVIGAIYEDLLEGFNNLKETGNFTFHVHRGVIYGPLNIIYGAGAVLMVYLLIRSSTTWYKIFLKGALIGGIFEYTVSLLQEYLLGTRSWDYSKKILNIQGRTAIPIMLFWGLACHFLIKNVLPKIIKLVELIPLNILNISYIILVVLLSLDMLISWSTLIRQTLRHKDIAPLTHIGTLYDKYYPDEFLKKYFANMKTK